MEESISSSEEICQLEEGQDNSTATDFGTGRSYECVFCKRGFTTAQALGGHMNIHRKDRSRNKPNSITSSKREENLTFPSFLQPLPSHHPHHHDAKLTTDHRTYFPADSSSSERPAIMFAHQSIGLQNDHRDRPFLNQLGEGLRTRSLGLRFGPVHMQDEAEKMRENGIEQDTHALDLELRLGHSPM